MTTQAEVAVSPLFEEQLHSSDRKIKVMIRSVKNKFEARSVFHYRPLSAHTESRWCGDDAHCDDECMLLAGHAKRCRMCMAPTKLEYLVSNICPDCDGRSELDGVDPHEKV